MGVCFVLFPSAGRKESSKWVELKVALEYLDTGRFSGVFKESNLQWALDRTEGQKGPKINRCLEFSWWDSDSCRMKGASIIRFL